MSIGKLSAWYVPAVVVSFGLSALTVRESIKFKRWFYLVIFETIVSRQEPFTSPSKSGKEKSTKSPKKEE